MRMKSQLSLIISFQVETSLTIVLFLLLSSYYYPTMISTEQGRKCSWWYSHKHVRQPKRFYKRSNSGIYFFSFFCLVLLVFLCQCYTLNLISIMFSFFELLLKWWFILANIHSKCTVLRLRKSCFSVKLQFSKCYWALSPSLVQKRSLPTVSCGAFFPPFQKLEALSAQNLIASFLNPLKYRFMKEMCFLELYICTCNWGKLL